MKIIEFVEETFKHEIGNTFTRSEIIDRVHEKSGFKRSSIIPSDYCYNRRNKGIIFPGWCLFERVENGMYKYLGPGYKYSGPVFFREKSMFEDGVFGHWRSGVYHDNQKPDFHFKP